jgi:RNA polymerase sigma-70 factor (ECF subfamily)
VTRSELVRQARQGDRDAFDILLTDVVDQLYRVARLILRDYDRAEDAVQETLVRCWRNLPGLRDPDRFDAWLNRILVRAITDEARRRRGIVLNLVRLPAEPSEADASSRLADQDEIARVFARLSVEHRTIVVLHHYLGMTTDEAARAIGIPPGTAKSRLHYATQALRAVLEADARSVTEGRALA